MNRREEIELLIESQLSKLEFFLSYSIKNGIKKAQEVVNLTEKIRAYVEEYKQIEESK